MIKEKDILMDLHVHSIFSLHAFSTVKENIEFAKKHGIKYIAITDHVYLDGTDINIKNEINRIKYLANNINEYEKDIIIVSGAEFNIGHKNIYDGHNSDNKMISNPWSYLEKVIWRPVGLHSWFVDLNSLSLDELFDLFKESSLVNNAFAHIERELHKIDNARHGKKLTYEIKEFFEKIIMFAKNNNIYLEVNESSLRNDEEGGAERLKYWLSIAKENGNKISLGSDAHYCMGVGSFPLTLNLLNKLGYSKDLILNCNEETMRELIEGKNDVKK